MRHAVELFCPPNYYLDIAKNTAFTIAAFPMGMQGVIVYNRSFVAEGKAWGHAAASLYLLLFHTDITVAARRVH